MNEIQSIKSVILNRLKYEFDYIRDDGLSREERESEPAPNINWSDRKRCEAIAKIPCVLWKRFKLSDVREWTERPENDDKLIIEALDEIAKSGRVMFLSIQYLRRMRERDILFHVQVGTGWSTFRCTDNREGVERLYADKPLKKSEMDEAILEVKKGVESIYEAQRKQLEARYGKMDLTIEKKLYHEDLLAEAEVANAQIKIARVLEKKSEAV